jgi:hypothetical protein
MALGDNGDHVGCGGRQPPAPSQPSWRPTAGRLPDPAAALPVLRRPEFRQVPIRPGRSGVEPLPEPRRFSGPCLSDRLATSPHGSVVFAQQHQPHRNLPTLGDGGYWRPAVSPPKNPAQGSDSYGEAEQSLAGPNNPPGRDITRSDPLGRNGGLPIGSGTLPVILLKLRSGKVAAVVGVGRARCSAATAWRLRHDHCALQWAD